jgi:large subunit ribosomal protein L9
MKVILISRFANLGNIGDIINVRDGYGKNFLIPQKKAIFYSVANYKFFEAKKQQFETENQKNCSGAEVSKENLNGKIIVIIGNAADDGKLYGSITTSIIADEVSKICGDNSVSKSNIILKKPIKEIGVYDVKVDLYSGIIANIKVVISRTESESKALIAADIIAKSPVANQNNNAKQDVKAEDDSAQIESKN